MEFSHYLKARREHKAQERIYDVASHLSSEIITYLAAKAIGDLPVYIGKHPRGLTPEEFVSQVETAAYSAIEERAPHFAGQLAINHERTRLASTENVRVGNHGWRNDVMPDGITIVLTPVEQAVAA